MMVTLGITKVKDTREWKVFWRENGRLDEGKAYYTDDPEDAAKTLWAMAGEAQRGGREVEISNSLMTRSLVRKYISSYDWGL